MKTNKDGVEIKDNVDFGKIVRISSVEGFDEWLIGQTIPLVAEDRNPTDWAYYSDYLRYKRNLPVVD